MRQCHSPIALYLLAVLLGVTACSRTQIVPPPQQLRIAAGSKTSSIYYPLGRELADIYNARLPNVVVSLIETTGSVSNIQTLRDGKADLAFTQAHVAYSAFLGRLSEDAAPYRGIRAIAKLHPTAMQIVVRRDSPFHSIADLVGSKHRVGVPSNSAEPARLLLGTYHWSREMSPQLVVTESFVSELKKGALDAGIIVTRFPSNTFKDFNQSDGMRLLSVEPNIVSRLRHDYPYFRPMTIPADTYEGQSSDAETIGLDNLLVSRSDLSDDLVAQLTRLYMEAAPELTKIYAAATIEADEPLAAPIPVHPGASRYYRERELFR